MKKKVIIALLASTLALNMSLTAISASASDTAMVYTTTSSGVAIDDSITLTVDDGYEDEVDKQYTGTIYNEDTTENCKIILMVKESTGQVEGAAFPGTSGIVEVLGIVSGNVVEVSIEGYDYTGDIYDGLLNLKYNDSTITEETVTTTTTTTEPEPVITTTTTELEPAVTTTTEPEPTVTTTKEEIVTTTTATTTEPEPAVTTATTPASTEEVTVVDGIKNPVDGTTITIKVPEVLKFDIVSSPIDAILDGASIVSDVDLTSLNGFGCLLTVVSSPLNETFDEYLYEGFVTVDFDGVVTYGEFDIEYDASEDVFTFNNVRYNRDAEDDTLYLAEDSSNELVATVSIDYIDNDDPTIGSSDENQVVTTTTTTVTTKSDGKSTSPKDDSSPETDDTRSLLALALTGLATAGLAIKTKFDKK